MIEEYFLKNIDTDPKDLSVDDLILTSRYMEVNGIDSSKFTKELKLRTQIEIKSKEEQLVDVNFKISEIERNYMQYSDSEWELKMKLYDKYLQKLFLLLKGN